MGLRPAAGGAVRLDGKDISALSIAGRRAAGVAYIPEDRNRTGERRGRERQGQSRFRLPPQAAARHQGHFAGRRDAELGAAADPEIRHQDP